MADCTAPWMTSRSQVTSGNRWIGFRGGPDELWQCLRPSQSYLVLAVAWGLFNVRHWFRAEWRSVNVEVSPPDFSTVLNVWPVLDVSEWLVLSATAHKPVCNGPFTSMLRVSGISAWHRWALEPSPGRGWCRLATGHRWAALAPSSLLPCFPFFPPSLSCANSSFQVS